LKLKRELFPWWLAVLILAALWRAVILASGAVSFHADEAIVGLMARHINQGRPIPVFFYGQPYMGSLDPLLVSLAFRLVGESVLSIRLVQSALYLAVVATTMLLAYRISGSRRIASAAGLLIALPPVVMTLYTTISLGGYGETLLIGNLLLIVGFDLSHDPGSRWRWLAAGALFGLGWWTNSLIVAYALPVAVLLIPLCRRWTWLSMAGAALFFCVFSAPWWLYNLNNDWQSVRFLLSGFQSTATAPHIGLADKLFGLLLLGVPALIGARFSWTSAYWLGPLSVPLAILYAALLVTAIRIRSYQVRFLLAMVVGFALVFVLSNFGVDATGRYLLPLVAPLAILIAVRISHFRTAIRWAIVAVLVGVNVLGTVIALRTVPPGLTPQFDPATDFTNDFDQAVIDFLQQHGAQYGYTTYWAAYRLAFLSGETVILAPALPYKASLVYTPSDRYPPYTAAVTQAAHPVYLTANLPQLDRLIVQQFEAHGITFQRQAVGPYTVFYDLSRPITPVELGVQSIH
jgi:4-amino-4-deoxy-L-arabinose transferase-like glycosyltransferase